MSAHHISKRVFFISLPVLAFGLFLIYRFFFSDPVTIEAKEIVPVKKGGSKLPVSGMVATAGLNTEGVSAMGTLLANEEVDLVAEITGKVVQICFEEGSRVRKGELLLKVDDSDLQAQLSRAEFQKKLLTEKLERQRILLQRESISREEFDQLQTDYNVLEADIELLKVKISRTEIRAPFDGTMGFRYVSEGSYVQPSSRIARLVDTNVLKFEFTIPERYAAKNLRGRKVMFRVTGKDTKHEALVYAVDPQVDVNTRAILLRARFDNRSGSLYPGMFANGTVILGENQHFIPVPSEAIVPELEGKRLWITRDGRAQSVRVETEGRDNKQGYVVSGVVEGDTILTGGLMQLREGVKVNVKL
ncbi:MAG: efflux RND transporter periplasmic adaptor subunit [Bacteroidales bacterium]